MENSTDKILAGLNKEQREAVCYGEGPLMIIAGAGTGKTRVITYRIAHLIATKKAHPREILALTFTEKAAAEMEERVDLLLPYGFADVWISTFHSFGDRILRNHALELGIAPDFNVLSQPEQNIFFREHLFDFPLKYYRPLGNPTRYIDAILTLFSRAKDEDTTPEEFMKFAQELQRMANENPDSDGLAELALQQMELAQSYQIYHELMLKHGNIDFGDQIALTLRLFREHPIVLQQVQERFRFILVDEFQDTNYAQFQLLEMLAGKNGNLTVVCDDDQSIYKFRGAAISNIIRFKKIYPLAHQVVLVQNYRSTQAVLDTSYRLICHNNPDRLEVRDRINKKLVARINGGPVVKHLHFTSRSAEADTVARMIDEKITAGEFEYRDFAILVRANNAADPFMRSLNMLGIPYQFSGSRGLYMQEEVRLLISFLRALTDFSDSISLYHLASSSVYQFSTDELTICLNVAHRMNRSLHHVFENLRALPELYDLSAESKATSRKIMEDLKSYLDLARDHATGTVLYQFVTNSGYLKSLVEAGTPEAEVQILNIAKFFDVVRNYSEIGVNDNIHAFTRYLDLLIEAGDDPATAESNLDLNVVNIMTVHKSKGLEFPVVFLVSLVQDKFPTRQRRDLIELREELIKDEVPAEDFHIQEERRLFYVGMTRAQQELYLTSARDYGGVRSKKVSQFVIEALDKPEADKAFIHSSAYETIQQYAPAPDSKMEAPGIIDENQVLNLSHFQVDDYLTCPLKYKYIHVLRVPILRHHTMIYGQAIHSAVQEYNRRKALDQPISLPEVLSVFKNKWSNRGFLSRQHEEERFRMGQEILTRFFEEQEQSENKPTIVEQQFSFVHANNRIVGRWDRIDINGENIKIIDFKTSEVREQNKANVKTRNSLQLGIYALAYQEAFGQTPDEAELHFLETGLVGHTKITEKMLNKTITRIEEAACGIRKRNYQAKPDFVICTYCAFSNICPASTTQ